MNISEIANKYPQYNVTIKLLQLTHTPKAPTVAEGEEPIVPEPIDLNGGRVQLEGCPTCGPRKSHYSGEGDIRTCKGCGGTDKLEIHARWFEENHDKFEEDHCTIEEAIADIDAQLLA